MSWTRVLLVSICCGYLLAIAWYYQKGFEFAVTFLAVTTLFTIAHTGYWKHK